MKPLCFVIPSLTVGGAERVASMLANYWVSKGAEVDVITFDDGNNQPFYPLDIKINHEKLNILKASKGLLDAVMNNVKRILRIRRALKKRKNRLIVSFMTQTNILVLLASVGLDAPVIICERNNPKYSVRSSLWSMARRWLYPLADKLVVQTISARNFYSRNLQRKCVVIPNPVVAPLSQDNSPCEKKNVKTLLAMGRLVKQKGFDLLIEAYSKISAKYPDWRVSVYGDGPERTRLMGLRDSAGLSGILDFPGVTVTPHSIMRQSNLFVLSSRYEGFPNVLIEAMACGLPVVSFDCAGPRDIITDRTNGILVPEADCEALATGLDGLMGDEGERRRLANNGQEVIKKYNIQNVAAEWLRLFEEVSR